MEIALIFLILICLVFIYSKLNSKFEEVSIKLSYLHDLYHDLVQQQKPKSTQNTATEQVVASEENVEVPIVPAIEVEPPKPVIIEEIIPQEFAEIKPEIPTKKIIADLSDEVPEIFEEDEIIPAQNTWVQSENEVLVEENSWWDRFKEKNPDLEKFIGENLINKIGILILVLGISYFVKFAIDKNWISEPARVGIGVLAGGLIMMVAHRLRKNYKAFSSVFVAGAIAVFYLTIAIAYHDYHLFNQTTAFLIMVVITAFSSLVSLSYDRIELAALSLIGGFAVPFMVSTGEGNYIVLFSYIGILNTGILSIAYFKRWMLINIQVYVFTMILFAGWFFKVVNETHPPYFGAMAFAFLFYVLFILMNILNSIKDKAKFTISQIVILVSNTFIFYGEGLSILTSYHPELRGVFTTLLSVFNLVFAWVIYKKSDSDKNVIYLLIGLSLSFITLAVPIQFKGNYITLFWAAEAVLLMWLAQKSKIVSFRFGSLIVQGLMGISMLIDWIKLYGGEIHLKILINPAFISSVFSIISVFAVWHLLKADDDEEEFSKFGIHFNAKVYRQWLQTCGVILLYVGGFLEIYHQAFYFLESMSAPSSVLVVYHFIFSAVLIYFLKDKKGFLQTFAIALSILNILLFVFVFSIFAFGEIESYIRLENFGRLAYALHWVMLLLVAYFVTFVYKNLQHIHINSKAVLWISAFVIVYFASSELLLHSMFFSLDIASDLEIKTYISKNAELMLSAKAARAEAINWAANKNISEIRALVVKTGFPILWAVLVFAFLLIGIKKKSKHLRIIALVLLGITIAKLFIYDIRNASETGKIIAFILLGVLILIISFVYQKIRQLVINNEVIENNNPTDEA